MSKVEIKESIIDKLDQVDETMLLAVEQLLVTYVDAKSEAKETNGDDEIVGYEVDGTPISKDALVSQLNQSDCLIDSGESDLIPMEDTFIKAKEWLTNTK